LSRKYLLFHSSRSGRPACGICPNVRFPYLHTLSGILAGCPDARFPYLHILSGILAWYSDARFPYLHTLSGILARCRDARFPYLHTLSGILTGYPDARFPYLHILMGILAGYSDAGLPYLYLSPSFLSQHSIGHLLSIHAPSKPLPEPSFLSQHSIGSCPVLLVLKFPLKLQKTEEFEIVIPGSKRKVCSERDGADSTAPRKRCETKLMGLLRLYSTRGIRGTGSRDWLCLQLLVMWAV
jgi:hypothetical protein